MKRYKLAGFKDLLPIDEIAKIQNAGKYMPIHKRILAACSGNKILDLGCGIGSFAMALAQSYPNTKITAISSANYEIEVAQALYNNTPNLSFYLMNALNLTFDNQEFDCVCFLEVIEHLDNPVKAIKEIYRILKPGARLILSTNNVYYWRFFLRQIVYDIFKKRPKLMRHIEEDWGSHLFAWDISTLYTLLHSEGFSYSSHFYVGRFGFYSDKIILSNWIDKFFGKLFPFFKTTMVIILQKE